MWLEDGIWPSALGAQLVGALCSKGTKGEREEEKKPELKQSYSDIQTPGLKMCQVCCNSSSLTLEYFHKSGFPGNILYSLIFFCC